MKRFGNLLLLAVMTLAITSFFTSCEKDDVTPQSYFTADQNGYSQFNQNALRTQLNSMAIEDLTAEEEAGLIFMREEEKLAHDVYIKLYETWGRQVFNNIAASEQTHTEAVLLLLERYNLQDPVGDNGVGVFVNADLQLLYDQLVARGNQSVEEAFRVGAAIEEIDILDLQDQLTNVVDNQDITLIYESLQKGSRNHLRAFVRNMDNIGITYAPEYLSQAEYDVIIAGDMENGPN
ncbi:MAG: DUF2202 domain-containing protein [Saprospiraceae bacterium]